MSWVTGVETDVLVCHCRATVSCKFAYRRNRNTVCSETSNV